MDIYEKWKFIYGLILMSTLVLIFGTFLCIYLLYIHIYIKVTLLIRHLQLKRIITYGPQQNFDLSVI